MGVPESEIWLGARATEANIKDLSDSGRLADYRIVHFATHGVIAGEFSGFAEPALVLTPPGAAHERDDGLLTASEVAQLRLDADWVVMSACNTAAGGSQGAEALTGLARAFFYAGTRTLLVSHWHVYSEAAVKITTRAFAELAADDRIGRAEALRRSMAALIDADQAESVHPAYWAPFVLVGEGAGR
jgi:CHAT domain-containing protein